MLNFVIKKITSLRPKSFTIIILLSNSLLLLYAISPFPGRHVASFLILFIFTLYLHINNLIMRSNRQADLERMKALFAVQNDLRKSIDNEKYQRILHFVRQESTGKLPANCLILMTVPRSGSTWLMDSIRCHPNIFFEPSAILYDKFGLSGGRYPVGLSDGSDAVKEIEIASNRGALIPEFSIDSLSSVERKSLIGPNYAIEKVHPEFYNFQVDEFTDKVKLLEVNSDLNTKFIYQIRDPKAVLTSFLNYKKRDPEWYSSLSEHETITYMTNTYEALLKLAQKKRGLIIDYRQLKDDLPKVLVKIYKYIWPEENGKLILKIASEARNVTDRKLRLSKSKTSFLDSKPEPAITTTSPYHNLFIEYSELIDLCYEYYDSLLSLSRRNF